MPTDISTNDLAQLAIAGIRSGSDSVFKASEAILLRILTTHTPPPASALPTDISCAHALVLLTAAVASSDPTNIPGDRRICGFSGGIDIEHTGPVAIDAASLLLRHLRATGFKCPACSGDATCQSLLGQNIGPVLPHPQLKRVLPRDGNEKLHPGSKNDAVILGTDRRRGSALIHGLNPPSKGSGKSVAKADTSTTGAFSTARHRAKNR